MNKRLLLSLIVILATSASPLAAKTTSNSCLKFDQKINLIKHKMRQGYTITQGEFFRYKLADLHNRRVLCEEAVKVKARRKKQKAWLKKRKALQQQLAKSVNKTTPEPKWTSSSPSKARLKKWQLLQQQEAEKFGQFKKQPKATIIKP